MKKEPVHLFVGLYDTLAAAERDFDGLKRLHDMGRVKAYDAAVLTRSADGVASVDRKKRTGHPVWTGLGVGALVSVLTPFVAVPFGLIGAGTGALARRAQAGLPKEDARALAEALDRGEAALAVVTGAGMSDRVGQFLPGAVKRVTRVLDVDEDDFAEALREAKDAG